MKKGTPLQAVDPSTGIWTAAKVVCVSENGVEMSWPGYSKDYDSSIDQNSHRIPIPRKSLSNSIKNSSPLEIELESRLHFLV